jgi:bifunctional DNase/RNase
MSKKIDRNNIHNDDRYENIPILLDKVVVNPEGRVYIVLSDGEKKVACEIAAYEASILNFVIKEYHTNSHVLIVHQMFMRLLNHYNSKIESICIENKVGDVIYSSIKFSAINIILEMGEISSLYSNAKPTPLVIPWCCLISRSTPMGALL